MKQQVIVFYMQVPSVLYYVILRIFLFQLECIENGQSNFLYINRYLTYHLYSSFELGMGQNFILKILGFVARKCIKICTAGTC